VLLTDKALQAIYPEHSHLWKKSVFSPQGNWKDIKFQRAFFDRLAIKLNIQKPEDWYSVTNERVLKEGGYFISRYYNTSVIKGT
jgi:hypothetical protein